MIFLKKLGFFTMVNAKVIPFFETLSEKLNEWPKIHHYPGLLD